MIDAVLERLTRLHPKAIDLSLDRVRRLLERLGNPERRLPPVIHIAGTNGKGSTTATLRAIFEAVGQSVHAYTSPHLVRFAERVRVAGRLPTDEGLIALLAEVEAANGGAPITFFEVTTAAALLAFSRTPADVCLLETGLGGRLDATNVVERPALTILTPIALDHQGFLGDTIEAIAAEKAAIIKPSVPCVSAAQDPQAMAVIAARAAACAAPLAVEGRDFHVEAEGDGLIFRNPFYHWRLPRPSLPGAFQLGNAGLAVAAVETLFGDAIGLPALAHALTRIEWPARLQRLSKGPLVEALPAGWELFLDGGHNPHAAEALARHIDTAWNDRPLLAVMGMLNTKDLDGYLRPLARRFAALRTVTIPGEANAIAAETLAARAAAHGLDTRPAASVAAALAELVGHQGPARVLICGSLYLAGTVLRENG